MIPLNSSFHHRQRGARERVARETVEGRIDRGRGRLREGTYCVDTGSGGCESAPSTRYASQSIFSCLPCLTFLIVLSHAFPPPFLEQHTKYPKTDYSWPTSTSSAWARPHSPRDRTTDRPARIWVWENTVLLLLRLHPIFRIMIPLFLDFCSQSPHSPN